MYDLIKRIFNLIKRWKILWFKGDNKRFCDHRPSENRPWHTDPWDYTPSATIRPANSGF